MVGLWQINWENPCAWFTLPNCCKSEPTCYNYNVVIKRTSLLHLENSIECNSMEFHVRLSCNGLATKGDPELPYGLCNRANRDWNAVGVLWFKRFDPEWRYIMLHYTLCSIPPTHLCWTEHITTHWGWLIFHSFYFALHTMNLNFPRFFPSHV